MPHVKKHVFDPYVTFSWPQNQLIDDQILLIF